jgi:hypothetical protein
LLSKKENLFVYLSSLSMIIMSKKWFGKIIKSIILIASFAFISYKLRQFFQVTEGKASEIIQPQNLFIFVLIILLMALNWTLEAIKWKYLIKEFQKIKIKKSLKSVLIGITAGLLTPKRLGEIGGRIVLLKHKNQLSGLTSFVVGSFAQTSVTVLFGLIAGFSLMILYTDHAINNFLLFLVISLLLLSMLLFILFNLPLITKWILRISWLKKKEYLLNHLSEQSFKKMIRIFTLSLMRYLVFTSQFVILLNLFGSSTGFSEALIGIGLIYLIITFLPLSSVLEIGVRGSVASFIFGIFTAHPGSAVLAVLTLWIINLGIPSLLGAFVIHNSTHIENELVSLRTKTINLPLFKRIQK